MLACLDRAVNCHIEKSKSRGQEGAHFSPHISFWSLRSVGKKVLVASKAHRKQSASSKLEASKFNEASPVL